MLLILFLLLGESFWVSGLSLEALVELFKTKEGLGGISSDFLSVLLIFSISANSSQCYSNVSIDISSVRSLATSPSTT